MPCARRGRPCSAARRTAWQETGRPARAPCGRGGRRGSGSGAASPSRAGAWVSIPGRCLYASGRLPQPNQQLAWPISMESAPGRSTTTSRSWRSLGRLYCNCTTKRLTGVDSIRQSGQALLRRVTASIPFRASGKEGELKGDRSLLCIFQSRFLFIGTNFYISCRLINLSSVHFHMRDFSIFHLLEVFTRSELYLQR